MDIFNDVDDQEVEFLERVQAVGNIDSPVIIGGASDLFG